MKGAAGSEKADTSSSVVRESAKPILVLTKIAYGHTYYMLQA